MIGVVGGGKKSGEKKFFFLTWQKNLGKTWQKSVEKKKLAKRAWESGSSDIETVVSM